MNSIDIFFVAIPFIYILQFYEVYRNWSIYNIITNYCMTFNGLNYWTFCFLCFYMISIRFCEFLLASLLRISQEEDYFLICMANEQRL